MKKEGESGFTAWLRAKLSRQAKIGRPARQVAGELAEQKAASFLKKERKMQILLRNWRSGRHEIDLICRDREILVFVEVRMRQAGALVSGYHSVDKKKKASLLKGCKAYLWGLPRSQRPRHFRFDIVEVRAKTGADWEVQHYANVPLFPKGFVV